MDPISLIIAAIVAGAAAGAKDTASSAVKDAYSGLKALIRRRFAGDAGRLAELSQVEENPDGEHEALAKSLAAVVGGRDDELVQAAQALLRRVDPAGAQVGRYNVQITGGKGIAIGESQTVTMTFNDND